MTTPRSPATFDELLAAVGSLTDQLKVLVSAVDDLRCEVEWQAKNIVAAQSLASSPAPLDAPLVDDWDREVAKTTLIASTAEIAEDSLLSAAGRLHAYEKLLSQGRRGLWQDDWVTEDDAEIPCGLVFSVSADVMDSVLAVRPAHVVGDNCCCEADMGAPYVLAWCRGNEFLLRELNDEEAYRLQELCLACQANQANHASPRVCETPVKAQRGLF